HRDDGIDGFGPIDTGVDDRVHQPFSLPKPATTRTSAPSSTNSWPTVMTSASPGRPVTQTPSMSSPITVTGLNCTWELVSTVRTPRAPLPPSTNVEGVSRWALVLATGRRTLALSPSRSE